MKFKLNLNLNLLNNKNIKIVLFINIINIY